MTTHPAQVLIVDDESEIRELIAELLRRDGHHVDEFRDAEEVLGAIETNQSQYDLFIVDWMLPGISGIELTEKLRKNSYTEKSPILMLTGKTNPEEIIQGLEAGADDYITKPFEARILVARLKALLRRSELNKAEQLDEYIIGDLVLKPESHEAFCKNEKLNLTPYEFKLLETLILNQGKVLTREKLIEIIQGSGVKVIDRAVDTHIFWLRKKLADCSNLVETVRGVGYRIKSGTN